MGDRAEHNAVTELFEVVFEQEAMGMALRAVDPNDSRWLRVNQKFCDMLGYTREELLQLTSVEISLPDERHLAVEYNERLLRGDIRSYSREKRYLRKDGTEIWTNVWLSPVLDRDGNPIQIISVIHDITEQKKAETALMESEARVRAVFDNSPVCLNLKDTDGRYLFANKCYEEWWGHSFDEVVGKKAEEFDKDIQRIHALTRSEKIVLETGAPYESEISVKRPSDGKIHDRLLIEFPVKSPDGLLLGLGTFAVDITDRKRAEEELIRHRDHLQELVDRATQELKAKANELEASLVKEKALNKLQRDFVSMVSHEFRTPLAIIDATAQRMKSRADNNRLTPEDAVQRVEKIREAVKRMTRLMESMLTAACMEQGVIKVGIGPCDIGKLVREVCARQQEIAQTHVISCDLADLPVAIQADSGSLEQVLANLLSNAVKYAPDAPDIEVRARTEGDQVVIFVHDHGVGIGEDELGRIGERFFRAETSTGIAGTGIGLNLAKTLVEMHGGTINIESQKGEGSTFIISLPIAGPDRSEQVDSRAA